MSAEQARAMEAQMTEMARADGVEFRFDRAHLANTFDGHRLVHLAAEYGRPDAMKDRLFRANFTDGELVSDHKGWERHAPITVVADGDTCGVDGC